MFILFSFNNVFLIWNLKKYVEEKSTIDMTIQKKKHPLIYVIPHSFKNIFWNPIHPFNIISPKYSKLFPSGK